MNVLMSGKILTLAKGGHVSVITGSLRGMIPLMCSTYDTKTMAHLSRSPSQVNF